MPSIDAQLKYLFVAEYEDGSAFVQPEDDRSSKHDEGKEHNPSAYADIDHERLIRFHLIQLLEGEQIPVYSVDLRDGHFEVYGTPFVIHDQLDVPQNLELIYFRETRREITMNTQGETVGRRDYINRYFIGWKGKNQDGKVIQHMIGVA